MQIDKNTSMIVKRFKKIFERLVEITKKAKKIISYKNARPPTTKTRASH